MKKLASNEHEEHFLEVMALYAKRAKVEFIWKRFLNDGLLDLQIKRNVIIHLTEMSTSEIKRRFDTLNVHLLQMYWYGDTTIQWHNNDQFNGNYNSSYFIQQLLYPYEVLSLEEGFVEILSHIEEKFGPVPDGLHASKVRLLKEARKMKDYIIYKYPSSGIILFKPRAGDIHKCTLGYAITVNK